MSDIVLTTQTTPATPGSGKADLFVDSVTKQVKSVNDAGVVAAYLTEAGHNVAAAVHGLPASVNVLGNRNAAGEFVQRGTGTVITTGSAATLSHFHTLAMTFAVAFGAAPNIYVNNSGNAYPCGASLISASGFTVFLWDGRSAAISEAITFLAIGT